MNPPLSAEHPHEKPDPIALELEATFLASNMRALILSLVLSGILTTTLISNHQNTRVTMNTQRLTLESHPLAGDRSDTIRVAVIGDLHVHDTPEAYKDLETLVTAVITEKPDLIVLLGDYTSHPDTVNDLKLHRQNIATRLEPLTKRPVAAVLGNYETWSDALAWEQALADTGIRVLTNRVSQLFVGASALCLRGLGDAFTQQYRYVDFPEGCEEKLKLTMTHDPAAAFKPGITGTVLAAHTHCGQVRLPLLGALWVPSDAPLSATCGLYADAQRTLWVTSGVGTSILPIRLGTQSQWDLLTIRVLHSS